MPSDTFCGDGPCHDGTVTTPPPGTPAAFAGADHQVGRLPLRRPLSGRVLLGVCAGLAAHLGVRPHLVRWLFALLTLVAGAGVALYLWFVVTVPIGDPRAAAEESRPTRLTRLVPRLRAGTTSRPTGDLVVGGALLLVAALLLALQTGAAGGMTWVLPLLVLVAGAGLAWSQLDAVEKQRLAGEPVRRRSVVLRVGGGVALAILGVMIFVAQGRPIGDVVTGVLAGLAILAGTAFVLAPLGLRLWRDLVAERAAREREAERADIAAHLHDSVLQTLSLIRSRADDPQFVRQMARGQERELREWLYTDRPEEGDSVAQALRDVAAEVEDARGVPIDVVTAGDTAPDERTTALVAAAREALINAVKHGAPPISVYVEVGAGITEVFVRDRGEGFDLETIPEDRHGIRGSIYERMARHGGRAGIRTGTDRGTEVHLSMPHATSSAGHATSPSGGDR